MKVIWFKNGSNFIFCWNVKRCVCCYSWWLTPLDGILISSLIIRTLELKSIIYFFSHCHNVKLFIFNELFDHFKMYPRCSRARGEFLHPPNLMVRWKLYYYFWLIIYFLVFIIKIIFLSFLFSWRWYIFFLINHL